MDGDTPDEASEAVLAEHVRAERVRFVFIQSALPILFSPVAASLLAFTIWSWVDHTRLVVWTIGLAVIACGRVALVRTYPAVSPSASRVRAWERTFVGSILLVDLWWGIGALTLLVPDQPAERALVFSFLMMMAGGHSSSYAAHPATVLLGVLALVVPIATTFVLRGDRFHVAMSIAALMYLAATFRSIRTLEFFFGRTHRLAHEVQKERDRAEMLARTDALTSLSNRRAFYELGEHVLALAARHEHAASLIMIDIDHFKTINDQHGHAAGDAVIRAVADLIREHHRATDVAGRLGGEEFALLLPETPLDSALVVAERLRDRIGTHTMLVDGTPITFTTSLGVAGRAPGEPLDKLIARADSALYAAKHAGRNRVATA
ncbi:MAG TPA: GGDEF domain-containing protein [Kofleriaceae bacterium]|jgi:diguanylate cyclase (GGDEF)-like protein|nr:GGDEF domain-containing protein [Kofleriaceae bacterium]